MSDFATQRRNIEKLFKKRAFCGHYMERRLVNERRGYRDIVWLSPEETELAADLSFASEGCRSLSTDVFTSYSTNPVPSMWVALNDVPLGCHWFQITSVVLNENELIFYLKTLRSFPGVKYPTPKNTSLDDVNISLNDIVQSFQYNFKTFINNIRAENIIGIIKFIIILFTTLATGLFQLIFFLGDFSIKLFRELTNFTKASTPVMLGCLEFVSKIIGGFYILLAMLWRGSSQPRQYGPQQFVPAIDYRKTRNSPKFRQNY